MGDNDALLKIKENMEYYKLGEEIITKYQLEFSAGEISHKLEQTKKVKKVVEIYAGMSLFPFQIPLLIFQTFGKSGNIEDIKNALIKELEENLGFLKESRAHLEKSLSLLFESWELYVNKNYVDTIKKSEESKTLIDKSIKNCLIGILQEIIRNTESKISLGKKLFAPVKNSRKLLGVVKKNYENINKDTTKVLTEEDRGRLEKLIADAKETEEDAQLTIDDAKSPFVVRIMMGALSAVGGIWAIYAILDYFKII